MTHFTVVACVKDPGDLERALAPYDENMDVEPYRVYEDGGAAQHWAVKHLREESGLNPDDVSLTWQQLADAYNARDCDDREKILIDEDGRAYTMSARNPQSMWDYWRIGGRWGGYFPYRAGHAREILKSQASWDSPGLKPGHCDGGPKRVLDLDGMRDEKAAAARRRYAEFTELTRGTPEPLPWRSFADNISPEHGYTPNQAREEYYSQPRIQALKGTPFDDPFADDVAEEFNGKNEAQYAEIARARAVPGYAIITTDGRWMAPGRMGWFATSTDGEGDRIGYWEASNAYIDALDDEVFLVALDCHI
jgi:hypothetical protein